MKHNYGKIVGRYLEDEQHQMLMHEQGYTQTDMEEFDRIAHDSREYVATPTERTHYKDQNKVVQPCQGGGSDTVKTEAHPECQQIVQWKKESMSKRSSRTRC